MFDWEEEKDFSAVFLDIQMGKMSGIELARRIRRENRSVGIIFTTGITDYMQEGYEVAALHYLIKPISSEKVMQCMNRVLEQEAAECPCLCLKLETGVERVELQQVWWISALRHNAVVCTEGSIASSAGSIALACRKQLSTLELLNLQDEMYKGRLPVEKRSDYEYVIEFSHVWFQYPGADDYALKDFSLKLKIGEKLAIVGMNGSGKTTMIKLLCRFYEPQKGQILLNGVDIKKFREDEYRRLFSVVFQDLYLFPLKLGENVAGEVSYDRVRAEQCLRDAGFGERLDCLPDGLDTYLYKNYEDSGVEISGGEAQKIAIARALYKEAPFILLDEPTAALDPKAEYEIYTSFDKMVGKKTAIYISHRLSSCRFCDDIAVFDEGRLVQRGSHEELVKDEKGKYFELWSAQAQYYA